jgi:hypothetical protein
MGGIYLKYYVGPVPMAYIPMDDIFLLYPPYSTRAPGNLHLHYITCGRCVTIAVPIFKANSRVPYLLFSFQASPRRNWLRYD